MYEYLQWLFEISANGKLFKGATSRIMFGVVYGKLEFKQPLIPLSVRLNYEKCHHGLQSPIYPFSEVCLRVVAGGQLLYNSLLCRALGKWSNKVHTHHVACLLFLCRLRKTSRFAVGSFVLLTDAALFDMLPDVSPDNRQTCHFLSVVEVMKEDSDKLLRHNQFILFPSLLTGTVLYKTFCCTSHPTLSGRSSSVSPLALIKFLHAVIIVFENMQSLRGMSADQRHRLLVC